MHRAPSSSSRRPDWPGVRHPIVQARAALLVVATLTVAASASAATWRVPEDAPTIQAAIDSAQAGDVVDIADGTYTGAGNHDLDLRGKGILVRSRNDDPALCVIDCQGRPDEPRRGFWIDAGEDSTTVIRGLRITGGGGVDHGAGILVGSPGNDPGPSPRIINCVIDASDGGEGGAIAIYGSARLDSCVIRGSSGVGLVSNYDSASGARFLDCVIEENAGHGVRAAGGHGRDLFFERCTIQGNGGDGFRLHLATTWTEPHLVDCDVNGNTGWGVHAIAEEDMLLDVSGGRISGNGIGGVKLFGNEGSTITHCAIDGNHGSGIMTAHAFFLHVIDCDVYANDGHGVFFGLNRRARRDAYYAIESSRIRNNALCGIIFEGDVPYGFGVRDCLVAGNGDDGIRIVAEAVTDDGVVHVQGCTVADNGGAGIAHDSDVDCEVERTILAFNQLEGLANTGDRVASISCSDIFGNLGGDWVGPIADQVDVRGNFSADPCFCDVRCDYRLCADSWCLPGQHPWGCDDLVGTYGSGCGPCGCGGTVAVEDASVDDQPERRPAVCELTLAPNPCNPRTTVVLRLSAAGPVRAVVHDLRGRLVANLLDAVLRAGVHEARWDGRITTGRKAPSGVYVVRVEAGDRVVQERLALIR